MWNEEMIVAVKRNLCNCVKKPEKNSGLQQGLNPWPHDTSAISFSGFLMQLYKLRFIAAIISSFYFISAVHIWFISYIINNMQMYHSDVDVNQSALHESAQYQNNNCHRSFLFCDELILYIWQESQDCLHVDFECFKLALCPTLKQKFKNFWSFFTPPSDKHDEN